jgi:LmbE family N-acetylglucosaminyl deacetylase
VKRVYLAPHLDDAVLSCGGAIHRQVACGDDVLVITFFAGDAPEGVELSPFALEQHGYWGNPHRPMALRRAEDIAALILLGASAQHLDYVDAVYRSTPAGQWLYTDLETLFGEPHPADPVTPNTLAAGLADLVPYEQRLTLYAPLAAGHHVDHQVVHQAACRLLGRDYRLAFYEDYPYAQQPGSVEAALAKAGAGSWHMETLPLNSADLASKVSALGYYRTQMSVLFGGAEAMPSRIWAFAASQSPEAGLAERIWWP